MEQTAFEKRPREDLLNVQYSQNVSLFRIVKMFLSRAKLDRFSYGPL